mmetsp:Transcript_14547/g.40947  ORF Transcript_14547/g.40947 Transcript_14547/m.40947 type:complete len:308 (-) Transcript_14547:95-1018(-)
MQRKDSGKFAQKEIKAHVCGKTAGCDVGWAIMPELQKAELSFHINTEPRMPEMKTIMWKRQTYDPDSQTFGSQSSQASGVAGAREEDIPYVMLLLTGEEFVSHTERDSGRGLLRKVAAAYPGFTLGMVIIGLRAYAKKREQKEYKESLPGSGFSQRKALEVLPMLHTHFEGVYHRLVVDVQQAAEHVKDVTLALAKQPYEDQKNFLATFGMGLGSSKPSYSTEEPTMCKALCQLQGLSVQYARAITSTMYRDLGALLDAYEDDGGEERSKQQLLVGLQAPNGRKVGTTLSKRIFEFLTCDDPDRVVA